MKTNLYRQIADLVAKSKIDEALRILLIHFDTQKVILQSAKFQSLKQDIIAGNVTYEQAQIEKTKVSKALLHLASEAQEEYPTEDKERISKKVNWLLSLFFKDKKRIWIPFLFFLYFTDSEKLKRLALSFALVILTIGGITYVIVDNRNDSKALVQIETKFLNQSENTKDSLNAEIEVIKQEVDSLNQLLIKSKRELQLLVDACDDRALDILDNIEQEIRLRYSSSKGIVSDGNSFWALDIIRSIQNYRNILRETK